MQGTSADSVHKSPQKSRSSLLLKIPQGVNRELDSLAQSQAMTKVPHSQADWWVDALSSQPPSLRMPRGSGSDQALSS